MFDEEKKVKNKLFENSIKDKDLKSALICVSSQFETNYEQELKLFEISNSKTIFEVMNELAQEGISINDKYLALACIYYNPTYYWDIGVGTHREIVLDKYPYLARQYEEKIENPEYCRTLFLEWKKLFDKMIQDKVPYKDERHSAEFYKWAHDYEEYVIESTAHNLLNVLFSQTKKEELINIIIQCPNYPKEPHAAKDIDRRYNKQNSRYYDVQYLATWLSSNAMPLVKKNPQTKMSRNLPLISQGLIQEINLIYKDLIKDKILLEPEDLLIVEKLYEQRLPELLNEYENFDHKNYAELTHKNKNANDLLFSSLTQMHEMLESFNEKLTIKKVENLSFNLRLTKEFIKHNF